MTSLKGDLRSIMGTPFGGVGHAVLIFSRVTRAAFNSDSVVLQLHDRIEMPEEADGKFRVDGLDPGPIRIELEGGTVHNHGWNIDLPDEGVWSLTDLVDAQVDWSPAVIGRAEAAAREARDHADRAEAGADRVGTAEQVGVWADEASSSASAAASARSAAQTARNASQSARDAAEGHANRAATSESNAATSETNAKQSEDNAGDYAAVATTAATEAVDAMESASDAVTAIGDSVYEAAGHADRAEQYESGAAAYAQNASDAADRVGTADQIEGWVQQAQDAADRIGTAEQVEGWVDDARNSASSASQSESKAREYRDSAATAANSAVDDARIELGNIASDAADYATDSSRSAARAKTSETNAATHEANSLSAAERAEFAAEETIQQVEGDFATRNYVDSIKWAHGQIPSGTNLDEFTKEGTHYAGSSVSATVLNRPPGGGHPADLIVKRAGPYVYQCWTTYRGGEIESETFYRWSLNGGATWAAWRKRVTEADLRRQNPTRPAVLKQRSRIRRGGVIGTNGATPVALTFDHGFGNFRDKVLPILRRLGLPATVAFNDGQMSIAENGGATWADLQTWGINHGIEYAHHAQSHSDVAVDNLESALTSSISAASTNMPALVTDAFIMPGVSGTKWQGFNGGNANSSWWEHPAGQIIATHFPVVSGTTAGYYVPTMGGEDNTWTMYRYSFDNDIRADYFKTKIQNLAGTGMGIAGFMHPSVLDNGTDGTSLAKLTEILEFLAAERDAGRVEVLTLSGFAYADTSTSRRLELGTTWDSSNQCVIDVGENMAWLKGAQVLISTTPTLDGGTSIAVTDDTGRSSSILHSATAGVPIYRAITIPTDASKVTVTCRGNSRSIRVV